MHSEEQARKLPKSNSKNFTVYTAMRVDRWGSATVLYCGVDLAHAMEANCYDKVDEPAPDKEQAYHWKLIEDIFPSWKNSTQEEGA